MIKPTEQNFMDMDESQYSGWVLTLSANKAVAHNNFQEILDDYEKARKFDSLTKNLISGADWADFEDVYAKAGRYPKLIEENQNLKYQRVDLINKLGKEKKLRELIEKEIPKCKKECEESTKSQKQVGYYHGLADAYGIILQLLEESKK